jgi:hypothetical protein
MVCEDTFAAAKTGRSASASRRRHCCDMASVSHAMDDKRPRWFSATRLNNRRPWPSTCMRS